MSVDYVARARARLAEPAAEARRRYDAAHPDLRQIVDDHADYLARRDGLSPAAALEAAQAQALAERVL